MRQLRTRMVVSAALSAALVGAATVASGGAAPAGVGVGSLSPELQEIRASVAKYHDVNKARADGYSDANEPCVAVPGLGGMGIHFVDQANVLDGAIDVARPEMLLYAPTPSGGFRLLGVEYMVADADGNLATDDDRPSLFGRPFDGPMPGHAPWMPVHYDLHAWVGTDNPAGDLETWNQAVACP